MQTEIQYIPFNQLVISPLNVRTVDPAKEKDKELMASIRAEGVLQNLIVHKKGKKFAVCAGGRRFAALTALRKKGDIEASELVPCKVADNETQAVEWSLHENSAREEMHPADEFVAYKAMVDGGKTVKEVAGDFGVTQAHVKRLLKLAAVAPKLIEHFRAGKLDLDDMQAFAITDDHEAQLACYESLPEFAVSPFRIRQVLVGQAVRSDDRLAKFVTVAAYKKAGGAVDADLFEGVTYLSDNELVTRLAKEKLEEAAEAEKADGWKWVEVMVARSFVPFGEYPQRLQGEPGEVPDELAQAHKDTKAELDALNEKPVAEWTEEDGDRDMELEDKLDDLEIEMDQYRVYTAEQKAQAGVLVFVNGRGEMEIERGYMTADDVKAVQQATNSGEGGSEEATDEPTSAPVESQALTTDLGNYRLQAQQAEMLRHPQTAHDLLVFTLAEQLLGDFFCWDRGAAIEPQETNLSATADIEGTEAARAISEHHGGLDLSWLMGESRPERFEAFQSLTKKKKEAIMAHCVARTLQWDGDGLTDHLAGLMDFNLLDYWKPTADNYFRRVKADQLLEIGRDRIGDEWADENKKAKKGQLVDALAEADEMKGWLPDSLK
jgi:ParB family chromosome partitioning protein